MKRSCRVPPPHAPRGIGEREMEAPSLWTASARISPDWAGRPSSSLEALLAVASQVLSPNWQTLHVSVNPEEGLLE